MTLHYVSGGAAGKVTPAGFDLIDVSSISEVNALPEGTMGLVWLSESDGVTQSFIAKVAPFIGNPKVFGFFLVDEPDPTGQWGPQVNAADLKAESDWIHAHDPGAKTFITLLNMGSSDNPDYTNTYNPANTHIDYYGVDPYPNRTNSSTVDYSMIDKAVSAAVSSGVPLVDIIPVYQAFGGGNWTTDTGGSYQLPTSDVEQQIIDRWASLVPSPAFDYAYHWDSQFGDRSLASSPDLQQVFKMHNNGGNGVNLSGNSAANSLSGGAGPDSLNGLGGNDSLFGHLGNDLLLGGTDQDKEWGGPGADALFGNGGDDKLQGSFGPDYVSGDGGDDTLWGGPGADKLLGDTGKDVLHGNQGYDRLQGGGGDDRLYGGSGNDTLIGALGKDVLVGGLGADTLWGGYDADKLYGAAGKDVLYGGKGYDLVIGGGSNDRLFGNEGYDRLQGGSGNDQLYGGSGNDTLIGGLDKDVLVGGPGADTFKFNSALDSTPDGNHDVIGGFNGAEGDVIDLSAIDADVNTPGRDGFSIVGAFSHVAGQLLITTTSSGDSIIHGDVDGDNTDDFRIVIHGVTDLNAGDFVL